MKRRTIFALPGAAVAVVVAVSPAKSVDIHNCTPANIMIEFYNESDRIELLYKKRIDVAASGSVTRVPIPGGGTHKVKVFNASAGKQYLATYRAIDGNASYLLFLDPGGTIAMAAGNGC